MGVMWRSLMCRTRSGAAPGSRTDMVAWRNVKALRSITVE
ncbi:Uncharacterised protein [Mycobacteroides abscessus subsp. abscessus]|nr:Uncharacterised protein [Mycobacteroides abscessus subsp. abscessus]